MSAAALTLAYGLIIAMPRAGTIQAADVMFRMAFRQYDACVARRNELLAAPRYQGSVVLVDCDEVWAGPADFDEERAT